MSVAVGRKACAAAGPEDLAAFETHVLAGFVLARTAARAVRQHNPFGRETPRAAANVVRPPTVITDACYPSWPRGLPPSRTKPTPASSPMASWTTRRHAHDPRPHQRRLFPEVRIDRRPKEWTVVDRDYEILRIGMRPCSGKSTSRPDRQRHKTAFVDSRDKQLDAQYALTLFHGLGLAASCHDERWPTVVIPSCLAARPWSGAPARFARSSRRAFPGSRTSAVTGCGHDC